MLQRLSQAARGRSSGEGLRSRGSSFEEEASAPAGEESAQESVIEVRTRMWRLDPDPDPVPLCCRIL